MSFLLKIETVTKTMKYFPISSILVLLITRRIYMDNLFLLLAIVSTIAIPVFVILSAISFVKKDRLKGKKMIKFSVISFGAMFVSFILFGVISDSETETTEKVVETAAPVVEETSEEKATREAKEAEEKVVAEQKALEKAEAKAKAEAEQKAKDKAEAEAKAKEDAIPREHKAALSKAELYAETMHMSKAGVYDQLTSEYGEGFPAEAAQYAIDNIEFDWKEAALKKAKSYAEMMSMSDSAIYDQLISEHGEKFTAEEAQYAIDNL